jgi:hypothetical protein
MQKSEAEKVFDRYKMLAIQLDSMAGVVQNLEYITDEDTDYWDASVRRFKRDFSALVVDTEKIIYSENRP